MTMDIKWPDEIKQSLSGDGSYVNGYVDALEACKAAYESAKKNAPALDEKDKEAIQEALRDYWEWIVFAHEYRTRLKEIYKKDPDFEPLCPRQDAIDTSDKHYKKLDTLCQRFATPQREPISEEKALNCLMNYYGLISETDTLQNTIITKGGLLHVAKALSNHFTAPEGVNEVAIDWPQYCKCYPESDWRKCNTHYKTNRMLEACIEAYNQSKSQGGKGTE